MSNEQNIPKGFKKVMNYGMPSFVISHSIYPKGYHVTPDLPLPFIGIASQKNHIGFYHMGLYADSKLLDWFISEYPKYCKLKLDMGKSLKLSYNSRISRPSSRYINTNTNITDNKNITIGNPNLTPSPSWSGRINASPAGLE